MAASRLSPAYGSCPLP